MKKFLIIFTLVFISIANNAQNFVITKELAHEGSIPASSCPNDNNGNPCAKIIIDLPYTDVDINGSYIVGSIIRKIGRYEFYVAIPKKKGQAITLRHNKIASINIFLWDNGALVGREAYSVSIQVNEPYNDTKNPLYGSVSLNSLPTGADVFLNDNFCGKTPLIYDNLVAGDYLFKFKKDGYGDVLQRIRIIKQQRSTCNVELVSGKHISIITGMRDDSIYVDEKYVGKSLDMILIPFGEHSIYAVRNGKKNEPCTKIIDQNTLKLDIPFQAEAIDMGLSVKWASYNLGANKSEEYGGYYGWGDITGKNTSDDNFTYPYGNKNICGDEKYDIVHSNWGGKWRIPTSDEIKELIDNAHWRWEQRNGIYGYKITSLKNLNSIFLPAGGNRKHNYISNEGILGEYWTGSLGEENASGYKFRAKTILFNEKEFKMNEESISSGLNIRPVTDIGKQ